MRKPAVEIDDRIVRVDRFGEPVSKTDPYHGVWRVTGLFYKEDPIGWYAKAANGRRRIVLNPNPKRWRKAST